MTYQARIPIGQIYAMYAYYSEGHGLHTVADKFGMSISGVSKCFKRHGLHIRTKSHSLRMHHDIAAQTRAMYADYMAGMSHRQIADKYNFSASGVRYRFRAGGYKLRLVGSGRAA